jgi:hypothetical protein
MSLPIQHGRVAVLADKFDHEAGIRGQKGSNATKGSKRSKASSGKENRSVKGSATSAGGPLRV